MKKKSNKIQCIIIVLLITMLIPLMLPNSTKVSATSSSKKTLMFGNVGLQNISSPKTGGAASTFWSGDYLYWGNSNAMKWQILNKNSTEFNTQNPGLLIFSGELGKTQFDDTEPYEHTYSNSTLDNYITGQYENRLSVGEKAATLRSTNLDKFSYTSIGANEYEDLEFRDKAWFAPTGKMVQTGVYGFSDNPNFDDWARTRTEFDADYWLASYNSNDTSGGKPSLATVYSTQGGYISNWGCTGTMVQSRAATNIDTQSILFVSTANGGKTGNISDTNTLMPVTEVSNLNNDWKLTLKDSKQAISNVRAKRVASDKLEVTLDKKGNGNSISVIATDKNGMNILHYGRVATVSSGDVSDVNVTINLPSNIGECELKIFTEEYTNETSTDYASELVSLPVNQFTVSFDTNGGNALAPLEVMYNSSITQPIIPTRQDHIFDGWHYDKQLANKYDSRDKIISNITLYAKWLNTQFIDGNNLGSITFAAPKDSRLLLKIEAINNSNTIDRIANLKSIYDISVFMDGVAFPIKDTTMTIKLSLDSKTQGYNRYKVVYINDDGEVQEEFKVNMEDNGTALSFVTNHTSQYGIVAWNEVLEEEIIDTPPVVKTEDKPVVATSDITNGVECIAVFVLSLSAIYLLRKREN